MLLLARLTTKTRGNKAASSMKVRQYQQAQRACHVPHVQLAELWVITRDVRLGRLGS